MTNTPKHSTSHHSITANRQHVLAHLCSMPIARPSILFGDLWNGIGVAFLYPSSANAFNCVQI
jgi:hypothetical protein